MTVPSPSPTPIPNPAPRDFTNWLNYHNAHHPAAQLAETIAWEIYNAYYPCNCETCDQRKRLGVPPFRIAGERPDCKAPLHAINSAYVRSYLGLSPLPMEGKGKTR